MKKFFEQNSNPSEDEIQNHFYAIARGIGYDKSNMRQWFLLLYQVLFGQDHGPKFGSFIKIFGINNFLNLIQQSIERQ